MFLSGPPSSLGTNFLDHAPFLASPPFPGSLSLPGSCFLNTPCTLESLCQGLLPGGLNHDIRFLTEVPGTVRWCFPLTLPLAHSFPLAQPYGVFMQALAPDTDAKQLLEHKTHGQ